MVTLVCLSTVDRRSRDRFLESNQQISVLVEKFKAEGVIYMKEAPQVPPNIKDTSLGIMHKGLGRGIKPGCFSTLFALYLYVFLQMHAISQNNSSTIAFTF